jgi:signal transduction histidine kinase
VREAMGPVQVSELIESVGELYEPVAEENKVTLEAIGGAGLVVHGNRELIGQALSNLVDNAIKYGRPVDGVQKSVVKMTVERVAGGVALTVSDHGTGISSEDRLRVQERFVRLDRSRSSPGFGLGLSLVAAVVKLHGGQITLGDANPGLVVTLVLPAADMPASAQSPSHLGVLA